MGKNFTEIVAFDISRYGHFIKSSIEFPYILLPLIRDGYNAVLNTIIVKASILYNGTGSF